MTPCLRSIGALAVGLACASSSAVAQFSQSIFLEVARDPGRADVAPTARAVALGGIRTVSGLADGALACPACLLLAGGTDLVISGGFLSYARQELLKTPNQLPPWDPTRATSPQSSTPVGYAAIATRRPGFAVAAFYDGSTRFKHQFDTERTDLGFYFLYGIGFGNYGTGHGSAEMSVSRLGGAFAIAPWKDRISLGVAAYAVRLDFRVDSTVNIETWSNDYTNPTLRYQYSTTEIDRVRFQDWGAGLAASATVRPTRHLVVAARWQHEPRFAAVRELVATSPYETIRVTNDVQFRLPTTRAISGTYTFGRTTIATELAQLGYGRVFGTASEADPTGACSQLRTRYCSGWGFTSHRTVDARVWRMGIERAASMGRGTWRFRGGLVLERGYTLARASTDPSREGGSLPQPVSVTPYEPPRDGARWLTAGAAYAWSRVEIGVGVEHASQRTRALLDLRVRIR